jgi:hypothetical protein
MARVEIASQAWGVLIDATGRPLAAQSATLRNLDGTNATIWTAVTGGTSNTTALSSDSLGGLGQSAATRYVEEGTYTLTIGSTTHRVEATGGGALSVNLGHYGLVNGGNIATALTAAQSDIGSNAATISVPAGAYTHSTSLVLTEGQRLEAQGGSTQRWRSTRNAVKISYTGTGAAVKVQPGIGENRESVEIAGIHFDGTGASGSVDGLFLDGSATPGNVYIEGVLIDRCAFTNFPRYQARLYGQVFDITFRHCAFNNAARAADNLVHCDVANATTSPSQLTVRRLLLGALHRVEVVLLRRRRDRLDRPVHERDGRAVRQRDPGRERDRQARRRPAGHRHAHRRTGDRQDPDGHPVRRGSRRAAAAVLLRAAEHRRRDRRPEREGEQGARRGHRRDGRR